MKPRNAIALIIIATSILSSACSTKTEKSPQKPQKDLLQSNAMPRAIVYKTKADYSNLVSVTLNSEKNKIVSYPAPSDIAGMDNFGAPIKLDDGYLLSVRGISLNSVFLKVSLSDYSKFASNVKADSLYKLIIDKDPFVELYECGNMYEYKERPEKLNQYIRNHFEGCSKLK